MKVQCPQCQGTFRVEGHETGTTFDCPYCEARFSFRDRETPIAVDTPDAEVHVEYEREEEHSEESSSPLKSVEMDSPNSAEASSSPSSDVTRLLDQSSSTRRTPTTPPEELTDLRPGDTVNGYLLEEIIGAGGMSVVFRAKQVSLNRDVAFKVLRKDLGADPEFAERFRTEARALAELSHPNIVAVYDQGMDESGYYLVMEFIDGVSLRDVMEERRLTPGEALRLVPSLCAALEYAHSKNIIHRDIKPENILLDRKGIPRIADFGLVRIVGESAPATRLTKTQAVLGTLDYMAPEQREGFRDVDHRADIYSLGVVLYEMLTGELPIARFPRPSERADLANGIDDVVLKVLEKDRDRRYQRASMVARDLTRVQTGVRPHPEHDSAPKSIFGRVVAMGTSFSFFFFSAIFATVALTNANDEETLCLACGVAIPFYLGQLILNGILPRPVIASKNFFRRHPMIAGGVLAFLSGVLTGERAIDDEMGLFLIGLFIASGVLTWCWRSKIFRSTSAEPAFVPWAGPPDGYETLRSGRLPEGARQLVESTKGRLQSHSRDVRRRRRHHARAEAGGAVAVSHRANSEEEEPAPSATAGARPSAPQAPQATDTPDAPREKPFSVSTFLSFLVMLPIILVTIALVVLVIGFDGILAPLEIPMSYRETSHFFSDLWSAPLYGIEKFFTLLSFAPMVLLLVPFMLMFFALPGIVSRKKRGTPLFLITAVLFGIEAIALIGVSTHVHHVGKTYVRHAGETIPVDYSDRRFQLVESLQDAAETHSNIKRVALFHRASLMAESVPAPLEGRTPLIAIATDPSQLVNVRVGAILLLERLYGNQLFENHDAGNPPPGWVETFHRNAYNDTVMYPLRAAFRNAVETCRPRQW